ncbi:ketosynthase chain-length factor [Amycolatopsis sp. lyj-109]|uniref:ketosynthase chain-length factor n=1 Tax=Amycolatopsis sp. lyj-109 TaxID=2789287 RepID=UPI00397AD4C2
MTAVVTGLGVTAPNGLGIDAYWAATLRGESGIGRIARFDASPYPVKLAGEVPGFVAEEHLPNRLVPQTDRTTQLTLTATEWALNDAAVVPGDLPEFGMGVVTAATAGGFEFGHRELEKMWRQGNRHVSAYQSIAWFYAVDTGQISIRHGMRGPSGVLVGEQAGGLDAVAQARRQLRKGSDLIVSGGVDGAHCSWGLVAQWAGGRLTESTDPDRAYLPFDADASGYVSGEGGAILVIENAESARRRGKTGSYGEIAGCAATFDPRPGSAREPGLRRAIELALADAGTSAADVDVVFADAAGAPDLDRAEADAITAVFGPGGVPVTAPKTMTGRLYGGGGPLDLATALLSIRDGVLPPTVNVAVAPAYEIDLVRGAPRRATVDVALVLARGRGGFNSAVVLRAT